MGLLGSFVRINRQICHGIRRALPWLVNPSNYHKPMMARVEADLARVPGDILEVGGIDRPLLSKRPDREYHGLDVDESPACHEIYDRFVKQSVEEPIDGRYGVILSMTVLEHVPDNRASVRNMYDALEDGGVTHHYVPSANHPYSWSLRLVGPRLQNKLIAVLRPHAKDNTGYRAYFDCCTAAKMRRVFAEAGFRDVETQVFYSAGDYFAFFVPAWLGCVVFEFVCARLGLVAFASGFVIRGVK